MSNTVEQLSQLVKALEVGSYNATPDSLNQGAALQTEDLSPIMHNVTWDESHIKLQKMLDVKDTKSQLIQFNRQLDYGIFGGSAQYEGGIGEEDTSNFVRAVVPMSYYSTTRRVSVASNMIGTFDGIKSEDRSASDAAMKIAGDIEFDLFRGQDDFSQAGFFSGDPLAIADLPNIVGVGQQVRMSDTMSNTQDLMFAEYGSDQTVVLSADGALTQSIIEDAAVRSSMNHGSADKLCLDPISLSAYNKIAHAKERIVLAGSATSKTGAELRQQWTSSALVSLESSRFLSGKTSPARARSGSLAAPTVPAIANAADTNSVMVAGVYKYFITAVNERGESSPSPIATSATIAAGDKVTLTIANSTAKYYNVYRTEAGGTSAKFIGKVRGGSGIVFTDLGFRSPGSVTGFLIQSNTWGIHQLSAYSRLKMAVNDLSLPEAHFRFCCLAGTEPRKNVLVDNVTGQL